MDPGRFLYEHLTSALHLTGSKDNSLQAVALPEPKFDGQVA